MGSWVVYISATFVSARVVFSYGELLICLERVCLSQVNCLIWYLSNVVAIWNSLQSVFWDIMSNWKWKSCTGIFSTVSVFVLNFKLHIHSLEKLWRPLPWPQKTFETLKILRCIFFDLIDLQLPYLSWSVIASLGCFHPTGEKARVRLPDKVCWRTARSCTSVHQYLPAGFEGCCWFSFLTLNEIMKW